MKKSFQRLGLWMREGANAKHLSAELERLDTELVFLRDQHHRLSKQVRLLERLGDTPLFNEAAALLLRTEVQGKRLVAEQHDTLNMLNMVLAKSGAVDATKASSPPQFGERILLLVLRTKEERVNIPGDLEEEYRAIAAKHGARYAKLWYYKQVAGSAWPMMRKAIGWGLLTSIVDWIRRHA